jgi:hypothetical protein
MVEEKEALSDPIPETQVRGSDLVEAARSGYRFERQPERGGFVLTGKRLQPVMYIRPDSEEHDAVLRSLKLKATKEDYYDLKEGPGIKLEEEELEAIAAGCDRLSFRRGICARSSCSAKPCHP